jgi:hypothetical protein
MGGWDLQFLVETSRAQAMIRRRLFVILSQAPLHLFLASRAAPDKLVHPLEGALSVRIRVFPFLFFISN